MKKSREQLYNEKYEKAWQRINRPKLEKIFLTAQIQYNQIRLKEIEQAESSGQ
jgi:hypothetical protein